MMRQFFRFLLVGVANTAVGYAIIFFVMYLVGASPEVSNFVGYFSGLLLSYVLNRHFTFKSIQRRSGEFARFLVVFGIAYTANFLALLFFIRVILIDPGVSQILAGCVYIVASYLLNKYYVFRSPKVND